MDVPHGNAVIPQADNFAQFLFCVECPKTPLIGWPRFKKVHRRSYAKYSVKFSHRMVLCKSENLCRSFVSQLCGKRSDGARLPSTAWWCLRCLQRSVHTQRACRGTAAPRAACLRAKHVLVTSSSVGPPVVEQRRTCCFVSARWGLEHTEQRAARGLAP